MEPVDGSQQVQPAPPPPISNQELMSLSLTKWDGSSHFLSWAVEFESILRLYGFHDFLDVTSQTPEDMEIDAAEAYKRNSLTVYLLLLRHMPSQINLILSQLKSSSDPGREAWSFLMATYAPTNPDVIQRLRTELRKLQMGRSEPPTEYISRACALRLELQARGEKVERAEFLRAVIRGLHDDAPFVELRTFYLEGEVDSASEAEAFSNIMRAWTHKYSGVPSKVGGRAIACQARCAGKNHGVSVLQYVVGIRQGERESEWMDGLGGANAEKG